MRFDASFRQAWVETGDGWQTELPEGWLQGRSVFGGLTAAQAVALARRLAPADRALRTLTIHLLSPATPGPLQGTATVLREGKSVTFIEVKLHQRGKIVCSSTMVFGASREDSVRVAPAPFEVPRGPDGLEDLPYVPGLMPEFTQHVTMRWATGDHPFTGGDKAAFKGFCRIDVPAGDEEGLVGMLDIWPCPTLSMLDTFAAASTVSWTAHIVALPADYSALFGFEYTTEVGQDGFHTALGRLYSPDGQLLGWTEQLVAIFD